MGPRGHGCFGLATPRVVTVRRVTAGNTAPCPEASCRRIIGCDLVGAVPAGEEQAGLAYRSRQHRPSSRSRVQLEAG